ncbi:tetracycline resistance MFS efflux pump [soil metagenome]
MTDTTVQAPKPRGALFIVFLVVFIDLLGFGIVLPVMPRLADEYLQAFSESTRGLIIGCLYSSFSLMQFIFSPMWGRVSDRIGRRPILLMGLAGSVVFYGLFGFACTLPAEQATLAVGLMLLARIGAGIAGASVGTAAAVIADCTTPETRAKGMALIGIAFGGGFALGPLIAYFGLELFDEQKWGVGAIASGLSLFALILAIFKLPETRKPGAPHADRSFFSISRTMNVLRVPTVGPLILIYFLAIFAFANFEATLALFTKSAFNLTDRDNFRVFAYVGFVLLFAGGMYRPLVKKRPESMLLMIGIALLLAGMGILCLTAYATYQFRPITTPGEILRVDINFKPWFYLGMTIAVIGFAFVNPSVSALVSKRSDPNRQGEVLGVNQGCASLGRILGPMAGSLLFYAHPSRIAPFAAAAATLVVVLMLLPMIKGPKPQEPGEPVA